MVIEPMDKTPSEYKIIKSLYRFYIYLPTLSLSFDFIYIF